MTTNPYPPTPRPPWWHEELVRRVEDLDAKLDDGLAEVKSGHHEIRVMLGEMHGMHRMLTGIGAVLVCTGTILSPILIIVFHH